MKETKLERARRSVNEQRRWIAEHGADLAGYVARYGAASDPAHYGEGGEAIYAADAADLEARSKELALAALLAATPLRGTSSVRGRSRR
jgi:hypothetical protein